MNTKNLIKLSNDYVSIKHNKHRKKEQLITILPDHPAYGCLWTVGESFVFIFYL